MIIRPKALAGVLMLNSDSLIQVLADSLARREPIAWFVEKAVADMHGCCPDLAVVVVERLGLSDTESCGDRQAYRNKLASFLYETIRSWSRNQSGWLSRPAESDFFGDTEFDTLHTLVEEVSAIGSVNVIGSCFGRDARFVEAARTDLSDVYDTIKKLLPRANQKLAEEAGALVKIGPDDAAFSARLDRLRIDMALLTECRTVYGMFDGDEPGDNAYFAFLTSTDNYSLNHLVQSLVDARQAHNDARQISSLGF